jgi:two-component system, OmpR family, sensor kinase
MRRAFISLYLIIVASILIIGWGLDKAWEQTQPVNGINDYQRSLLELLSEQLEGLPPKTLDSEIARLNAALNIDITRYSLGEFSSSDLAADIAQGEPVFVTDQQHTQRLYQRLPDSDVVLGLRHSAEEPPAKDRYFVFILIFYLALAAVIYIWVWPLSRDLYTLQDQTAKVGRDGTAATVTLRRRSHVQPLANAFNTMSTRIRDLLASQKEMTYAVSHELRTPLARMKFALEMASESDSPQFIQNKLQNVREDVANLEDFVNELLSYAGFDQSQQTIDQGSDDWAAFCGAIVAELQQDNEKITIHTRNLRSSTEITCDWSLMERMLTNLIQNAQRFASARIVVTLGGDDQQYCVSVEDDGPGIAPPDREKVFRSFVRLNKEGEKKSGYGLGLAIVKRIMQWHGGSATVEASSLGGAKFLLQWPVPGH